MLLNILILFSGLCILLPASTAPTSTSSLSPSDPPLLLPRDNQTSSERGQVCQYTDPGFVWHYSVLIPDDGGLNVAGHDAAGNCGGGFLDNIRGQRVVPTGWGCKYIGAGKAVADFFTPIDTGGQVAWAFKLATGLDVGCNKAGIYNAPDAAAS